MTHLHIRVPTKTRLHELKMAWFFRNSLGSIFDDYSKFIIFNKIFFLKQITFLNMALILCFDLRVWEEIYEEAEGQSIKKPNICGKIL